MLKRLHLRNFTVFEDADFEFGPGLNVIVGANGTGKSHVLKLGYAVAIARKEVRETIRDEPEILENKDAYELEWLVSLGALPGVFLTPISKLIRRKSSLFTKVHVDFETTENVSFRILSQEDTPSHSHNSLLVECDGIPFLSRSKRKTPVLIPAKEVLTMGWLLPLYDRREIPIDETYPDLLRLLMGPPLRQPEPAHIVAQLQQLIGGKVEEEGGHFYLSAPEQPRMEMNLVAEGVRKFATLYKLLANGTLTPETTLFWDEPEANLNPALLKDMAAVLTALAKAGFQIILATHSLFLLKELHILAQREKQPARYFALYAGENGATQVETKDDFIQLEHVAALDAELTQTFDFEAALDDEYAGDS